MRFHQLSYRTERQEGKLSSMHVFEMTAVAFAVATWTMHPVAVEQSVSIWGDPSLRLYCLAGAILGSLAKELAFNESDTRRQQAAKLVSSILIATFTAPLFMFHLGIGYTPDSVVGASGAISFTCLAAIKLAEPAIAIGIPRLVQAWIEYWKPRT